MLRQLDPPLGPGRDEEPPEEERARALPRELVVDAQLFPARGDAGLELAWAQRHSGSEIDAVKARGEERAHRLRFGLGSAHQVRAPEGEQAERGVAQLLLDPRLVVVEVGHRRHGAAAQGPRGQRQEPPGVADAAGERDGGAARGNGHLGEGGRVDEVDGALEVHVVARLADRRRHHASGEVAEGRWGIGGVEVDAVDEFWVHHRGAEGEVVQLGNPHAVEEEAGRRGDRASHHRVGEPRREGRDARQQHDHSERLPTGAGDLLELRPSQSKSGDLGAARL